MQQGPSSELVLILGGVRSGKSRYAQQIAESFGRVTFLATAQQRDDEEMRQKIARHRAERPATWLTIEEPLKLANVIRTAAPDSDAILIDCITLFASNLLEAHPKDNHAAEDEIAALLEVLASPPCTILLVSNEVGSGVVPAFSLGRRFRDLLGEINQRIAAQADTVILMVAGLPLHLKGVRA
jgi:adenosylcobinamide kinase/adenosylcobinamide-phosphate guanylyltransferase